MINESYYVPININFKHSTTLTGSVPMSVLISKNAVKTAIYTTLQAVQSDYASASNQDVLNAATIYFNNGGKELYVFLQSDSQTDTEAINAVATAQSNFVWVSFTETKTLEEIETISTALSALTQQYVKFLAITSNIEGLTTSLENDGVANVAVLYSADLAPKAYTAIVIPAYCSGLELKSSDSVKSIVFTQVSGVSESSVSTTELDALYAENWNVVVNIANRYTILDGGKMCDGQPIHSAFGFAVFKKDCEDAITDLLVGKLPFDNSSNAVIENALTKICNTYVDNGLIGTQRIYDNETQTVTYNGVQYTTIEEGQTLTNGYYIYSIPASVASATDKASGKIPPIYIYVVINDVIRIVTITGEVSE